MKRIVWVIALLGSCGPAPAAPVSSALSVDKGVTVKEDFEKDNPNWRFAKGAWTRRDSEGRSVLAQTAETQPWAVALLEGRRFSDVDITVSFRPISGREDASGGIIFRAADPENYYLIRANALEGNFRLYTMNAGRRTMIATATVDPPSKGAWHQIRVVASGTRIQGYLDGRLRLEHSDETYTTGHVGLWTKADSVTEFDDLEIVGAPSK